MLEELLVTPRFNAKVDPLLGIWTWEISVYLFFGGLTAGLIVFAALAALNKSTPERSYSLNKLALWAPVALSLGMTTLFLDLEHKLFVFRFYTTFEPTSPMSWGAWILMVIYPVTILQILSTLRPGYPWAAGFVDKLSIGRWVLDLTSRYQREIAMLAIPSAVALGIYTGILLSAFNARPFWNSGLLGVLFLVSGLSTAAALVILLAKEKAEKRWYVQVDIGLILVEIVIIDRCPDQPGDRFRTASAGPDLPDQPEWLCTGILGAVHRPGAACSAAGGIYGAGEGTSSDGAAGADPGAVGGLRAQTCHGQSGSGDRLAGLSYGT